MLDLYPDWKYWWATNAVVFRAYKTYEIHSEFVVINCLTRLTLDSSRVELLDSPLGIGGWFRVQCVDRYLEAFDESYQTNSYDSGVRSDCGAREYTGRMEPIQEGQEREEAEG